MATDKDEGLTCPNCDLEVRFICEEPARGKTYKIKAEHKRDWKGFYCPSSVLARSTVSRKRKELAARCQYPAK